MPMCDFRLILLSSRFINIVYVIFLDISLTMSVFPYYHLQ